MWQGIDQRRFPRAKYKCTVTIRQAGEPTVISTVTENVGLGGVCILLEKGLDILDALSEHLLKVEVLKFDFQLTIFRILKFEQVIC